MLQSPNLLQLTGVLFLKEPAHQIVENNYKFADSYFYSLEQRGQKSFHRVFDEIPNGPNLTDLYFPDGTKCCIELITQTKIFKITTLSGYVCHADDLIYLFSLDVPIIFCNINEFFIVRKISFRSLIKCSLYYFIKTF